jgi:hypothetical protein
MVCARRHADPSRCAWRLIPRMHGVIDNTTSAQPANFESSQPHTSRSHTRIAPPSQRSTMANSPPSKSEDKADEWSGPAATRFDTYGQRFET